jgi:S-formylglutathione hydrolase
MEKPTLVSKSKCFDGWVEFYKHPSTSCNLEMKFSVFIPSERQKTYPILYFLAGLTSTEENFIVKAGAQRFAAENGIMLVCPDTSPRGAGVPGEQDSWDLGVGAGFYVNATEPKWSRHYRMYDYVSDELPAVLREFFPVTPEKESITGFSMGGHGAMVLALKQPKRYRSVSAFSPIAAPSLCPWGNKAFTAYLGSDKSAWAEYDSNHLVRTVSQKIPILIDQGGDDKFLKEQLCLSRFEETCREIQYPAQIRIRPGYDHSYYFVASFIQDHIEYHAKRLA